MVKKMNRNLGTCITVTKYTRFKSLKSQWMGKGGAERAFKEIMSENVPIWWQTQTWLKNMSKTKRVMSKEIYPKTHDILNF